MTIPLTGTGGLFTRLGKIIWAIRSHNLYRGDGLSSSGELNSIGPNINAIRNQFNSSNMPVPDSIYTQVRDPARQVMSAYVSSLATYAQNTIIQMANDSVPLNQLSLSNALAVLLAQMDANNDTITANTTSVAVTMGGSNTGNTVVASSVTNAAGVPLEYVFNENVTMTAITDSQSGGTQGAEQWRVTTPAAQQNMLNWDWPKGSGINATITASSSSGGAQRLANGGFESWSGSPLSADFWSAVLGTYGTNIVRAATPHLGTYSMSFVGDGSSQWAVRQKFNDGTTGTSTSLRPSTVYGFCMFVKMSATPAAGVFAASLVDSSNTVINNDAGNPNTVSITLTTVSTSWVAVTGWFQTPAILPTGDLYILLKLTTALSNSRTLYVDDVTMIQAPTIYTGGPYLAVYPGDTATVKGDSANVAVANNYAGGFQTYFQRIFNMTSLGYQLPSGGSPTISESLINGTF